MKPAINWVAEKDLIDLSTDMTWQKTVDSQPQQQRTQVGTRGCIYDRDTRGSDQGTLPDNLNNGARVRGAPQRQTGDLSPRLADPGVARYSGDRVPDTRSSRIAAALRSRGEGQVEEVTMAKIPYRIHLEIPKTDRTVDTRSGIQEFVRAVKSVDPHAWFSSTKQRKNFYRVQDVPPNNQLEDMFKCRNSAWRGRRDVIVYVNVHTTTPAAEIKRSHSFGYLKEVGVRAWRDTWQTEPFMKIGWLSHVHPTFFWIEDVQERIHSGLVRLMRNKQGENSQLPKFTLQTERRAFGNGENRVQVECVAIVTTNVKAMELKRLLSELYLDKSMPGVWCPIGIQNTEGPEKYLKALRKHKEFLITLTQVSVFGIKMDSLQEVRTTDSGRELTLKEYIKESTGALEVARTSRSPDLGKFNLIIRKRDLDITRVWIRDQLPAVYKGYAEGYEAFAEFPYPRRSLREDYTPVVGSYRQALLAHIDSEDEEQEEEGPEPVRRVWENTRTKRPLEHGSGPGVSVNTSPQAEPLGTDTNPTDIQNRREGVMTSGDRGLKDRMNSLELSLAAEKQEAETWRRSMTQTMNGMTQTQETMTSSLSRVTSMVQSQDERQQRIELTHQTITNLLPWLCQKMGHPHFQEMGSQTPSDAQMTPVAEKRVLVTPPDLSRKKVCQDHQTQELAVYNTKQESPTVMEAGFR